MFNWKARFGSWWIKALKPSDGKKKSTITIYPFFSFLFLIRCIQVWFDGPNIIIKTEQIRASPFCSTERPVLAYRRWRLWSCQTVKKSTRCTLFFSFTFLILCIQVWFDNPNNILKTKQIMASPSCSTERPTFGSWWIKALKPSDGKISNIVMHLIL